MGGKAHPGPLWPALGWKDRGARPRDKQRGPSGPRPSQAARPYLSPEARQALTHSLSRGSHAALGEERSWVPILQTRKLRLKKVQRLGGS